MASTILLSDNGVSSGSAGLKETGGNDGVLILQTTTSGGTATNAVTIDNNQLVAVGMTPSAWGVSGGVSGYKALQVGTASIYAPNTASNTLVNSNAYYDGSGWKYITNGYAAQYQQTPAGYHAFYGAPTGTAAGAVTFTTLMTLAKDNSVALQGASNYAGTGISFPATQNASSDANTLDDYEEGTWTSTLTNCGSGVVSNATYVKIGNVVTARLTITSGTFTLNNSRFTLPFSSANFGSGTFTIGTLRGGFIEVQSSSTVCYFATTDSGSAYCSITYITS